MLLTSEISRIKAELGYNVLSPSAAPYVDIVYIFEQVIQPYTVGGAPTTSSTPVAAASVPTPRTIVLESATDVTSGDVLAIDVDSRQERATIQSLTGTSAVVLLSKVHSGTYPVVVEGPEMIVRDILMRIADVKLKMYSSTTTSGTLKQVDEVQWYETKNKESQHEALVSQLNYWREQLAAVLGIKSAWSAKNASATRMSVY
jgi:hypothetical protein